jgi:hypothetical protein
VIYWPSLLLGDDEYETPTEPSDDFDHHDMCSDCIGSGRYVGFNVEEKCSCCEGSGWVSKGSGLDRAGYEAQLAKRRARDPWGGHSGRS